MKILFLGPVPPPITGQSLACKVFLDELVQSHTVEVVDLNKRNFNHGVDSVGRIGEVLSFVWQAFRKQRRADVIYFTISESYAGNIKDLAIYLTCFRRLSRMIVHLHGGAGMREILKPANKVFRALNGFFLRRLGAVIVLGARHVDMYRGIVPSDRIHLVPNFAEDSLFYDEDSIRFKFNNLDTIRILFLSNLIPGKGYLELVQAYKVLSVDNQKKVQLDFAGGFQSDEQKHAFLNSIKECPQIRYHGIVGGQPKIELFRKAHVFCLPTYYPYEGQPISILEAYASGCVVITTDHSGIFDIFADNQNGYRVEIRSSVSIRNALERALKEPATLLAMALRNRFEANELYRTTKYNERLMKLVKNWSPREDS